MIIIPIDIEIFFLLRPEKPLLYIGSAGAFSSIIEGKVYIFLFIFQ